MIDDSGPTIGSKEVTLMRHYPFENAYKIPEAGWVRYSHIRAFGDKKTCEEVQAKFKIKDFKIHKMPDSQYILIDMNNRGY